MNRDEYYMKVADATALRSTCPRGEFGAIIVNEDRIVSTGYPGAPRGLPHCFDVGCDIRKCEDSDGVIREHCKRTVHAEQNAIIFAGIDRTEGATLYIQMVPCRNCANTIINAGIKRVVCKSINYQNHGLDLLKKADIEVVIIDG